MSCVYAPEPVVSARLSQDLAESCLELGHTIRVICPHPSRGGSGTSVKVSPDQCLDPHPTIIRCGSYRCAKHSVAGRLLESVTFGLATAMELLCNEDGADLIYMNTWPVCAQAITTLAARTLKVPVVEHIQDIYPEALTSRGGGMAGRLIAWVLRPLDAWTARSAERVISISNSMRHTYIADRNVEPQRVVLCPNWQDERTFAGPFDRSAIAKRYGYAADRFTFMYLGNVGAAAGVEVVIRAFAESGLEHAQLIIVGEGSEKPRCIALAKQLELPSIHFISDPDPANVAPLQSTADVCLLPLKPGVGNYSIPSKFIAYLLSGKPVLATVGASSEMGMEIIRERCGWVGEPGDVDWLAGKMRDAAATPRVDLEATGTRARDLGLSRYSRAKQLPILVDAIESVARQPVTVI